MEEVVGADEAARRVLSDPMSRLLASQGMPVGLSLGDPRAQPRQPGGRAAPPSAGGEEDGAADDLTRPPRPEPSYQMEAFSDMLKAAVASARGDGPPGQGTGSSSSGEQGGGGGGAEEGGSSSGGGAGFTAGVQHVGPSLEDGWGTTRESPADIARRIAESNREAEAGEEAGSDAESDGEGEGDLALSPSEAKYASLEAMSADIKKLDEVFEILASVPWLDDDVSSERELKGVARYGLLGTLEEVGFNIRPQLLRIWAGERGAELASAPGLEFRDQAALLAILYHTQQIEERHGAPPKGRAH